MQSKNIFTSHHQNAVQNQNITTKTSESTARLKYLGMIATDQNSMKGIEC
jgi:hypothetical protein